MATDLGRRLRNEGAGVYYSAKAEHTLGRETFFGVVNSARVDLCHPRNHFVWWNLRYLGLPYKLKTAITRPDKSDLFKGDKLFFFHYPLNKKRIKHQYKQFGHMLTFLNIPNDIEPASDRLEGIITDQNQEASCILSSLLKGETLFVGSLGLMQQVIDYLKGGFANVLDITCQLIKEDLAKKDIDSYNKLYIFDSFDKPKYVCHKR